MTRQWPDDPSFSTESYLGAIERGVAGPDEARWARSLAERIDPRGQRDAAARAAWRLMPAITASAKAKRLAAELDGFLVNVWPALRDVEAPPPPCSELRRLLHRIVRMNGGDGLGWRRILDIVDAG